MPLGVVLPRVRIEVRVLGVGARLHVAPVAVEHVLAGVDHPLRARHRPFVDLVRSHRRCPASRRPAANGARAKVPVWPAGTTCAGSRSRCRRRPSSRSRRHAAWRVKDKLLRLGTPAARHRPQGPRRRRARRPDPRRARRAPGRQGGAARRRPRGLLHDAALRRLSGGAGAARARRRSTSSRSSSSRRGCAARRSALAKAYLDAAPDPPAA